MINRNLVLTGDWHVQMEGPASRIDDYKVALSNKTDQLLDLCLSNNADLVIPGDMFSKVQTDNEFILWNIRHLRKFKDSDVNVICIFGNHDVYRTQAWLEDKTPLKIMEEAGLVQILRNGASLEYGKVKIYGFGYYDEFTNPKVDYDGQKQMLIGHKFYQQSMYKEFNTSQSKLLDLGYDYALLGHDHIPYNIDEQGCVVFRPGGLMRGSTHDVNFSRGVFSVVFNTENLSYEMVQLKVSPMSDVAAETKVLEKETKFISNFKEYTNSMEEIVNVESSDNKLNDLIDRIKKCDGYSVESKNKLIETLNS